MVVLHDFTPCVDDELEVKRGQIVNILYRENDWVYIIGQDTRQEGFIPHSYCAPYNTHLADLAIKKKLPRNGSVPGVVENQLSDYNEMETHQVNDIVALQNNLKHSQASLNSEPDYLPFSKDPSGRFIVLYTFIARDENDVSVERGEFVTGEREKFICRIRTKLCDFSIEFHLKTFQQSPSNYFFIASCCGALWRTFWHFQNIWECFYFWVLNSSIFNWPPNFTLNQTSS